MISHEFFSGHFLLDDFPNGQLLFTLTFRELISNEKVILG